MILDGLYTGPYATPMRCPGCGAFRRHFVDDHRAEPMGK